MARVKSSNSAITASPNIAAGAYDRGGQVYLVTLWRGDDSRNPTPNDYRKVRVLALNETHARIVAKNLYDSTPVQAEREWP